MKSNIAMTGEGNVFILVLVFLVHDHRQRRTVVIQRTSGFCQYLRIQTDSVSVTSPTKEVAYRVNNMLQLLDISQSTILDEELSINNIISNEKTNTDYFTKTPYFKPTFKISHYTEEQQKFLTMFSFQHSQISV